MEEKIYIKICKAFSDVNRMKIFKMLLEKDMCAFEILKFMNCSQPTLSYHMKLLTDSGLVFAEKDWKWSYYSVDKKAAEALGIYFCDIAKEK